MDGRNARVKRVSFAERLVMQGIISPLFASRHASKVQKWLRNAQRQTLTLVLNVIVRGKRTSGLTTKKRLTRRSRLYRMNERKHNIHSGARVNSRYYN